MKNIYIIIPLGVIAFIALSVLVFYLLRKSKVKRLEKEVSKLQIKKNNLDSLPITVELSKIEDIAKSEQLEEKISDLKSAYDYIKNNKLEVISDKLVDLDLLVSKRDERLFYENSSEIEILLCEVEFSLNNILDEIKEISSYEEKYRDIVTKLKVKFRFLERSYKEKETLFKDMNETIKMQFENIAKRFIDFDKVMDEKLYNEIVLVVKSIDTMIDNLDIIIKEVPDILILLNDLIPGRIKDLRDEYNKMTEEGFSLKFLDFENNISNIEKRENDILTRAKVLNITDSLFDLRTILEYLDDLFKDLQEERDAKKKYDSLDEAFKNKRSHLEKIVKDIYAELDDIKNLYHLTEKDLEIIEDLNLKLSGVVKDYKKLNREIKKGEECYQKYNVDINDLLNSINSLSNEFDEALRTLGSFYEDEKRAHVELDEMKKLLVKCQSNIRNSHLPCIYDNYFIEEEEAREAILEVEKEIENKPIVIKSLNMRVETAKDLTFKLYKTTSDMIKYANFTEILFVYSNKYRNNKNVDKALLKIENLYFNGNYKDSYNEILKVIKSIDSELLNLVNKIK